MGSSIIHVEQGEMGMRSIFVSSTFRDFQSERDILNNRVRPELNMDAGQYGEAVSFCDLRWGIDTSADGEEAATQKILSVCMDQIDRSSPYMIVLLGDRYGYIPGAESVRRAVQQRGDLEDRLKDLEISITQLEIEYGLLTRPENKPHVYVYIRRILGDEVPEDYAGESAAMREKLEGLIQRILGLAPRQVRYYDVHFEAGQPCGLDRFAQMVRADLREDLGAEWEAFKDMPPFEKELQLQWQQIEENKERLKLHRELAEQTAWDIISEPDGFWALKGNSGCGKSVLMSDICHRLRQQGHRVIPALCQSSPITGDPSLLLDYLIFQLENLLGQAHQTFVLNTGSTSLNEKSLHRRKLEYLQSLCTAVPPEGPKVVLALDALDQLYVQQMGRYHAVLPNEISKGVRVLVTAVPDFRIPDHFRIVTMEELSGEDVLQAMAGIQSSYKKDLSAPVCQSLCRRKSAGNLLYLTMVMLRLCRMNREDFQIINAHGGSMEQIQQRQQEIVDGLPDRSEELAVLLMEEAAAMDSGAGIRRALGYLAVSRGGLRMDDLEALLGKDGVAFVPLDLYVYIHMLREFFTVRQNGCVDFRHKVMRNGLLEVLGQAQTAYHERLFDYLNTLPATDPLKNTQIVYHGYYAGHLEFIPRYLANLRLYGYYRFAFRMTGADAAQYGPKDFSMDMDYDFLCQQMAADLHTIIMAENIQNIEKLVTMMISLSPEAEDQSMAPIYWAEFVNKLLPLAFGETNEEQRMLYTLFSCFRLYIQELQKHRGDPTVKRNQALCCLRLARLASQNTNRDMNAEAVGYIREYVELIGQLAQECGKTDPSLLEEQGESREYLMLLLLQGGRLENMPEVLELGHRLLEQYGAMGKPEKTTRVHFNMGLAYEYSAEDPQTRENAFRHYMKAMELAQVYAEEKKDALNITYRILSTIKLGNMCQDVGNYPSGVQMFYLAQQYAEEAYTRNRDPRSQQYVLMAREGIGMCLMAMGGDAREQGRQLLMRVLLQGVNLLKQYSDPGLQEMCQRISKCLKSGDSG